jgi:tRNA nucleotidyltransferase/poly(A) polymerase
VTHPPAHDEKQRAVATEVVRELRAAGHEAWFVGGCVREMLLEHLPKDYDVTTDADPDRVEEIFDHVVEVGRRFGVMTVVREGVHVEVATFRTEASYSDGRRPDSVAFATAEEDVSRRDFTINALLYDPITEEIVDHVGGRADLEAGVVRTVGDPEQRFREDHLRLLRAVRFAARFGFRLEPGTETAIRLLAPKVAVVSPERIHEELDRMLLDPNRAQAVELLQELGLLAVVLPAVTEAAGCGGVASRLAALPARVSSTVAWASLLAEVGATELDELLLRLRFATRDRKAVEKLVTRRDEPRRLAENSLAARRRFLADPLREELLLLAEAVARAEGGDLDFLDLAERELGLLGDELPEPLVTGADLRATSLPAGPAYARILDQLLDEQMEGALNDREAALVRLAELVDGAG